MKYTTKTERMNREYRRKMNRYKYTVYSMDTFDRLYSSFRRHCKENRDFDIESYYQWYNTQAKPMLSSYHSKIRRNVENYKTFPPFRMIGQISLSLKKQLRSKYIDTDRLDVSERTFNVCSIGLDNYYSRIA